MSCLFSHIPQQELLLASQNVTAPGTVTLGNTPEEGKKVEMRVNEGCFRRPSGMARR